MRTGPGLAHRMLVSVSRADGEVDLPLVLLADGDPLSLELVERRVAWPFSALVEIVHRTVAGKAIVFGELPPLATARIIGLNYDFHSLKGHHQPLRLAFEAARAAGARAAILDGTLLRSRAGRALSRLACGVSGLVINGLHCFDHQQTLDLLAARSAPSVAYLHEGRTQFAAFERRDKGLFRESLDLLAAMTVLASSRAQAAQLESFGITPKDIVYNCFRSAGALPSRLPRKRGHGTRVLMVGSLQARKGVELFVGCSRAFESAEFLWIGAGPRPADPGTVAFLGPLPPGEIRDHLTAADALLLTSTDDPFPLIAGEALAAGCRVVCSTDIGTAELIGGIRGCGTFAERDVEGTLDTLRRTLASDLDEDEVRNRLTSLTPEALWRRLARWLAPTEG